MGYRLLFSAHRNWGVHALVCAVDVALSFFGVVFRGLCGGERC